MGHRRCHAFGGQVSTFKLSEIFFGASGTMFDDFRCLILELNSARGPVTLDQTLQLALWIFRTLELGTAIPRVAILRSGFL